MAVIKMEEFTEYPTFPPDTILHLKVAEARTKDVNGKTPDSGWTKLEFKFKILDIQAIGDGGPKEQYESLIGQHIWGSVPFRFTDSAENKLKQWCEAIFNMELGVGFELDTDLLENKQVRGITGVYDKRAMNPRTGKAFQAHQVESLLPMGGSVPPPQYTNQAAAPQTAGPLFGGDPAPAQQPQQQPVAAGAPTAGGPPAAPQPLADPWGSTGWDGDEPPF